MLIGRHPSPRKSEQVIRAAVFPRLLLHRVAHVHPELQFSDLAAVEEGLREWLICCAHRDGEQLGMPSRAVDWAWHELILNTPAYHALCRAAFGEYLHHVPESDLGLSMQAALYETVRAWDRSEAGRAGREPSLWELDERLGIEDPIGVGDSMLQSSRAEPPARRSGHAGRRSGEPSHAGWFAIGGGDGGGGAGSCGGGGCGGGGG